MKNPVILILGATVVGIGVLVSLPLLSFGGMFLAGIFFGGTPINANSEKNLEYGFENLQSVKEFRELYPDSSHEIRQFMYGAEPSWMAQTVLHDRYIFTMYLGLKMKDIDKPMVVRKSPHYEIMEVSTESDPWHDAPWAKSYQKSILTFKKKEWEKLYESGGDLTVLNLELKEDIPLENIKEFL